LANRIDAKELLVVTGKGGVGKSTVAATLGRVHAAERRVLVLELDPRENVHQMFGAPPSGGEIVQIAPRLWLQNLRPRQVLDGIVRRKLRIEALVKRVLESTVYRHFSEGAPGLKELAVLSHALDLVRGRLSGAPRIEQVILDAPATGHGISLLLAPQLVSAVIERGPVSEMTREVADWVGDHDRTGVVVVTLAEEMPVTEALELEEQLETRLARSPDLLVVNQLYPPLPAGFRGSDSLSRLWRKRRRLNESELDRLDSAWDGERIDLPLVPLPHGSDLVEALAERMAPLAEGAEV
jgi:anion-transporting  ArsA/GET3 family ATPase